MARNFDDMREHLDYEYAMMQSSYNLFHKRELWDTFMEKNAGYYNNLYQVDFFVHANNLLRFGLEQGLMEDFEAEIFPIIGKIKDQIITLNEMGRTAVMEEKLQPSDHTRIKELVEKVYGKTL